MRKSLPGRRTPRKIGQDDDELEPPSTTQVDSREPILKQPTNKPRKSSSLRTSFGPSVVVDEDVSDVSGVVTPKRGGLSRLAIQRNASRASTNLAHSQLSREVEEDEHRPSYSAASLQQLRDSTPSTPRDITTVESSDVDDVSTSTQALDLSSKFGSSLARYQQPSAIPSAAEIAEKKARRARLAKEHQADEYISLDPDDPSLDVDDDDDDDNNVMRDEAGRLVLAPKDKYQQAESRLMRDDEDIMEGFDDFTEDGQVSLGRKAEAQAARKRKADMAAQIAEAEGPESGTESDVSERERNAAFEAAQTKHGTYGASATSDPHAEGRPKTPPKISPLPTLDGAIARLRGRLGELRASHVRKLQEMEALGREKIRLAEEEVRIQKALKDTAEKFKQMRAEKGISVPGAAEGSPAAAVEEPSSDRRLGFGLGFPGVRDDEANDEANDDGIDDGGIRNNLSAGDLGAGLGFGVAGRGLGFGLSPRAVSEESTSKR